MYHCVFGDAVVAVGVGVSDGCGDTCDNDDDIVVESDDNISGIINANLLSIKSHFYFIVVNVVAIGVVVIIVVTVVVVSFVVMFFLLFLILTFVSNYSCLFLFRQTALLHFFFILMLLLLSLFSFPLLLLLLMMLMLLLFLFVI